MADLIALRAQADRAGAPALAILLGVIVADLAVRGYVNATERRLLLRGLARYEGRLAELYRRAVEVVEALVEQRALGVEMRAAA